MYSSTWPEDGYKGFFGFADYMVVPSRRIAKINKDLPSAEAGFLEPLATVVKGVKLVKAKPNETIAVIGAGTMGLLNALTLKAYGCKVILTESFDNKLENAKALGFDVIDIKKEDPVEGVMRLTNGKGVDAVVVAVGNSAANNQSVKMLKEAYGRILVFAAGYPEPNFDISSNLIHYKRMEIIGTFSADYIDFMDAAELLNSGAVKVTNLLESKTFKLDDFKEALEYASIPGKYREKFIVTGNPLREEFYHKEKAKVTKREDLYLIEIYVGLIERLYMFAEKVITEHLEMFFGDRKLYETQKYFFKDFLFMTWINFIILHEWSHILCGHLDYLKIKGINIIEANNTVFWEDDYTNNENNIEFDNLELKRIFELEADSKASTFILAYFIEKLSQYNNILRIDSLNEIWKHYYYILSFLFNFLDDLRDKSKAEIYSTHPTPLKRLVTMTLFIVGELNERKELKKFAPNVNDINSFFITQIYTFQVRTLNKRLEEIYEEQTREADYIFTKVSGILDKSGINDFRLIKARFI